MTICKKLLLFLAPLWLGFGAAVVWIAHGAVHSALKERLIFNAGLFLQSHRPAEADWPEGAGEAALLPLLGEAAKLFGGTDAAILDRRGRALAHTDVVRLGRDHSGELSGLLGGDPAARETAADGRWFYEVVIPVVEKTRSSGESLLFGGRPPAPSPLGFLFVRVPVSEVLPTVRRTTGRLAAIIAVYSAVSMLLGFFVLRRILGPIRGLSLAMAAARAGDFSRRVAVETADEIGDLSRIFNEMGEELERTTVSKNYLDSVLDSISDALIACDRDGTIRRVNRAAERLLGYSEGELRAGRVGSVVKEWDPGLGGVREAVLRAKDGGEIPVELRAARIGDPRGGFVYAATDLRERRRAENERSRRAKIESLGVMAGGIAHDFNNLLTGIMGFNALMKAGLSEGDPGYEEVLEIEKACDRSRRLTRQLLTFSKGGNPVKETTSLKELIEETVRFALHGSNVRAEFDIAGDLAPVEADKGQIAEVLHNLVLNADQAMPDGGILRVSAVNEGRFVSVAVRDEGVGIPEAYLGRIFEPYFTSKEKGHGLGLAVCLSIVEKHGGTLSAESAPGRGSAFTLRLPASEAAVPAEAERPVPAVPSGGRILVLDDEEMIGRMAVRLLKRLGFEAVAVPDGAQAVSAHRAARAAGNGFQAVLMDLTIPGGMGGREAAEFIRAADPGVRLIATSGYCEDPVMSEPARFGFSGSLEKPYSAERLVEVLAG